MKYGLNDEDFAFLNTKLISPLKQSGAKVYIFGSRATGKFKKFSDIDLLFEHPQPTEELIQKSYTLLEHIENSNFPYKIDLVDANSLAKSYKESILRDRIAL